MAIDMNGMEILPGATVSWRIRIGRGESTGTATVSRIEEDMIYFEADMETFAKETPVPGRFLSVVPV